MKDLFYDLEESPLGTLRFMAEGELLTAIRMLDPGDPVEPGPGWESLTEIPYGETISYAQLAVRIGEPRAIRAVGAANGRNPLPIVVPCHRVIGADGSLTGYAGGLGRKRLLLELEGSLVGALAPLL